MKSKLMRFYISDIHGRGFEVEALVCICLSGLSKLY